MDRVNNLCVLFVYRILGYMIWLMVNKILAIQKGKKEKMASRSKPRSPMGLQGVRACMSAGYCAHPKKNIMLLSESIHKEKRKIDIILFDNENMCS